MILLIKKGETMKILIAQPVHEKKLIQLEKEIKENPSTDVILFPEGYLACFENIEEACKLAKTYGKTIITSYKNKNNKDRAIIISKTGKIILDRAKTSNDESLYWPSKVEGDGMQIGYILCVEILKGLEGLKKSETEVDFIAHPIGVGMFSEEQFNEWINEAKEIAIDQKTMIIGTSHADGSYRNCGVSIPIAYCIDKNGEAIFIAKNDLRTRVVNTETKETVVIR